MKMTFSNTAGRTWTVEESAMKTAKWELIDSGNSTTWEVGEYRDSIEARPSFDEAWWDGIVADDVPAIDVNGNACTISIGIYESENETSYIFINATTEVSCVYDEEEITPYELAKMMGFEIGGRMRLDYDAAVDSFLEDNENCRYIMHNHRGFANEWTLMVCKTDDEADEMQSATESWTEYDSKSVRPWLRDAMMTREDYKAEYGCAKYCSAMFAEDYE